MPIRELPARPNLEHLKKQARQLLRGVLQEDASAVERFREVQVTPAPAARLAQAQLGIAREYGFDNWANLKAQVGALSDDPVEALTRLFPTVEDRARVERGMERLKKTKEIRLESDSGTKVTFNMTGRPVIGQYGYTDEPGRWDHWPGAFQYTIPNEGFGDGLLIMDPGDIWYPAKRFLTTPVRMQFEKGAVVSIEGGYDAFMIKDYIEGWKDPEGFAISHLGWGSHPRALWNSLAFQDPLDVIGQDGRTMYGTTLIALGENATFGGKHTTGCHQDFALRRHRFFLDDELIADAGKIIPKDLQ